MVGIAFQPSVVRPTPFLGKGARIVSERGFRGNLIFG
jgi:hypothetical protein